MVFGEAVEITLLSDLQHEDGVFCAESASPSDLQRTGGGLDSKK